jgi:hypothetical protein
MNFLNKLYPPLWEVPLLVWIEVESQSFRMNILYMFWKESEKYYTGAELECVASVY